MKLVGLFAGIGGLELGLKSAGHTVEAFVENDPFACKVLESRFNDVANLGDVTELSVLPACDLVACGFPCQDLSPAGNGAGIHGAKSRLIREVLRLLDATRRGPGWLLFENVPFMLSLKHGAGMKYLTSELENRGYRWAYRVIDSRAFGLAQRRRRLFIVAARSKDPARILCQDEGEAREPTAAAQAEQARTRALDPALPPAEVTAARRQMDDSLFARDRLRAALPRLRDRLKQLRNREEDARRTVAYEKACIERDQLAAELARVYPPIAKQLADLAARLAANDRVLSLINNHARPRDSEYLRSAEEVARGIIGFGVLKQGVATPIPRITRDLRLPAFEHPPAAPYAWPPRPESSVDYSIGTGSLRADKAGALAERQTEEEAVVRAEA